MAFSHSIKMFSGYLSNNIFQNGIVSGCSVISFFANSNSFIIFCAENFLFMGLLVLN